MDNADVQIGKRIFAWTMNCEWESLHWSKDGERFASIYSGTFESGPIAPIPGRWHVCGRTPEAAAEYRRVVSEHKRALIRQGTIDALNRANRKC